MEHAPADLKAWKQKVHSLDMALRTVQTEAAADHQKNRGARLATKMPKLPFNRASSPSPL